MVRPGDLQDRNFDQNEPRGAADVHAAVERMKGPRPVSLEDRIAKARTLAAPHGVDEPCWVAGRDAAIREIAGE